MRRFPWLSASIWLLATTTSADHTVCGYQDRDGATWDLTGLINLKSDNFYSFSSGDTNFFVNFCQNITAMPPGNICGKSESQVCIETDEVNTTQCAQFATRSINALTHGYAAYGDNTCVAVAGTVCG